MRRKQRYFNTTGPCNPEMHYMLNAKERVTGAQLHRYVDDRLYWMLHAPRQTGKTTFLHGWMREINEGGEAIACYVSVERARGIDSADRSMPAICNAIAEYASNYAIPAPAIPRVDSLSLLSAMMKQWAAMIAPKPLVVLFDEVDVLTGETIVSFLGQLRGGFAMRGIGSFPVSVALVGMRDLRDYITASKHGIPPGTGSPFNIKADSATLSNFSREDTARLFAQHTDETGRQITQEALDYVYEQSQGQPWMVNTLFAHTTLRIPDAADTSTVTLEHLRQAREQMCRSRETHLDALSERLKEPRIRRVIQPIITGDASPYLATNHPDTMLAIDLGLVRWDMNRGFTIANPIYEEILTRSLHSGFYEQVPTSDSVCWKKADGRMDMDALLREFQNFWSTHSEVWEEWTSYTEAFPHLLLMAFMQRLVNGGGRIEREYASGRGRMDLAVEYRGEWNLLEVKLLRSGKTFDYVKAEGIRQIARYRDRFAPPAGGSKQISGCYLVIFDRRSETSGRAWNEKFVWIREENITIVGC